MSINKSKRGLSAGGTGLGFNHLKTLTSNSTVGYSDICTRLARFATLIVGGKMCKEVGEWFATAYLVPLRKTGDGRDTETLGGEVVTVPRKVSSHNSALADTIRDRCERPSRNTGTDNASSLGHDG